MQTWSQTVDPALSLGDLAGLASRLTLPAGWSYRTRTPESPLRVELLGRLVDLKERFLKHVFGGRAIAEEADEEVKQLALVALGESGEVVELAGQSICLYVGHARPWM